MSLSKIFMEGAINERLWEFMKRNSITIRSLSELLDINEKTLGHKISGRSNMDIGTLLDILSLYSDLSPDWLLLGRGPMLRSEAGVSQNNVNGDNIQGDHVSVRKASQQVIRHLQQQLEEEKERSKDYWNTIQKLLDKRYG